MATLAASARGALVSFLAAAWTAACTSSANSPTSTGADPQCQVNTCNPAIGSCALAAGPNGIPCDDGNACTAVDTCVAGACVGTGNACECQSDAACAVKEDGNVCNGTLFCNKATGKCQLNPATEIICPTVDDWDCMKNLCNPKTGQCAVTNYNEGQPCDDGDDICTLEDTCYAGECKPGADTCECRKVTDCLVLEDGNLCNGTLYCDKSKGKCIVNPTTLVT